MPLFLETSFCCFSSPEYKKDDTACLFWRNTIVIIIVILIRGKRSGLSSGGDDHLSWRRGSFFLRTCLWRHSCPDSLIRLSFLLSRSFRCTSWKTSYSDRLLPFSWGSSGMLFSPWFSFRWYVIDDVRDPIVSLTLVTCTVHVCNMQWYFSFLQTNVMTSLEARRGDKSSENKQKQQKGHLTSKRQRFKLTEKGSCTHISIRDISVGRAVLTNRLITSITVVVILVDFNLLSTDSAATNQRWTCSRGIGSWSTWRGWRRLKRRIDCHVINAPLLSWRWHAHWHGWGITNGHWRPSTKSASHALAIVAWRSFLSMKLLFFQEYLFQDISFLVSQVSGQLIIGQRRLAWEFGLLLGKWRRNCKATLPSVGWWPAFDGSTSWSCRCCSDCSNGRSSHGLSNSWCTRRGHRWWRSIAWFEGCQSLRHLFLEGLEVKERRWWWRNWRRDDWSTSNNSMTYALGYFRSPSERRRRRSTIVSWRWRGHGETSVSSKQACGDRMSRVTSKSWRSICL